MTCNCFHQFDSEPSTIPDDRLAANNLVTTCKLNSAYFTSRSATRPQNGVKGFLVWVHRDIIWLTEHEGTTKHPEILYLCDNKVCHSLPIMQVNKCLLAFIQGLPDLVENLTGDRHIDIGIVEFCAIYGKTPLFHQWKMASPNFPWSMATRSPVGEGRRYFLFVEIVRAELTGKPLFMSINFV